jgi:Na+/proline symporter
MSDQATAASALGDRLLEFFPRLPESGTSWHDFWSGPFCAFMVFISVQWWANKNADGGGVLVQRMSAAKNERHSLLATLWFNVAHYALRPWPWILVAVASMAVFPELADDEAAYPEMVKRFLPSGLMGLMVTSFLAAFMSTIDTHANLSASYIVNDVYRRFVCPGRGQRHYVWVSRAASLGLMLISSAIALRAESISALFKFMLAFSSGVGLVYIMRWFWWRLNAWSEITAMIASSVIASFLYLAADFSYPTVLAITVAGSAVICLAATYLTAPVATDRLIDFYRKVRPVGAWRPVAAVAGVTPAGGLGRSLINWLAGTVMILAATISVGKFLVGSPGQGGLYLVAAVIGAIVIWPEVAGRRHLHGAHFGAAH